MRWPTVNPSPEFNRVVTDQTPIGPLLQNGRYGYINWDGEWVIDPKFEQLASFSEGLAAFVQEGKLGFINTRGEVVIGPQFSAEDAPATLSSSRFSEGLACIWTPEKSGYINSSGEWVIEVGPGSYCFDFREGKAIVHDRSAGYLVIDRGGTQLSQLRVYEICYASGVPQDWDCFPAWINAHSDNGCGALNWKGEIIIPAVYAALGYFHEEVAVFAYCESGPFGLMNKSREVTVEPTFLNLGEFSEGLAVASKAKKAFGFVDVSGEFVIPPVWHQACSFSEGLACVTFPKLSKGENRGFINSYGEVVIEPRFRRETTFQNGWAEVEYEDKVAVIDRTGKIIWERPLEFCAKWKLWH
jgi:hypothetical protein